MKRGYLLVWLFFIVYIYCATQQGFPYSIFMYVYNVLQSYSPPLYHQVPLLHLFCPQTESLLFEQVLPLSSSFSSSSVLCMRENTPYFSFLVFLLMLISRSTNGVTVFFFMPTQTPLYTHPVFLCPLISWAPRLISQLTAPG